MEQKTNPIRSISVKDWRRLALEGNDIPIQIGLQGDSMRPLVRRQIDPVTIVPLRRPVRRGDVVLFADDAGRYVVHRVWKQTNGCVTTLGDHCMRPDAPLNGDQIWGLVVKVARGGRTIPLDNAPARFAGRIWMALLPVRVVYYKIRNFQKRRIRNRGTE